MNTAVHPGSPHPGSPHPAVSSPSYVLVVDDEPLVREFLARCLEGGGYAVKKAGTASEAMALMQIAPASVVLCDVRMPDHNGFWLADQLRTSWPETKVVMVTGIDDLETVQLSREVGAVDYVTKPILPAQLLKVVHRAATVRTAEALTEEPAPSAAYVAPPQGDGLGEAEYTLESPVRCPSCACQMTSLRAVRLIRTHVTFTSTLPRRGRLLVCPHCQTVVPAELSSF